VIWACWPAGRGFLNVRVAYWYLRLALVPDEMQPTAAVWSPEIPVMLDKPWVTSRILLAAALALAWFVYTILEDHMAGISPSNDCRRSTCTTIGFNRGVVLTVSVILSSRRSTKQIVLSRREIFRPIDCLHIIYSFNPAVAVDEVGDP